jgi:hypothetical protein
MPQRIGRVIIHNTSSHFKLVKTFSHLCHGEWTPGGWEPPAIIEPGSSGAMQSESAGIATGTEGYVKYDVIWDARREGMIYLYWDNPYLGVTHPRFATNASDVLPDCDYDTPSDSSTFTVDKALRFHLVPTGYRHTEGGGDITAPGDLLAGFAAGPIGGVGLLFGLVGIVKDPVWEFELREGFYDSHLLSLSTSADKFRSHNYPDRFIRHRNFLGELTPEDQVPDDFKFRLVSRGDGLVALRSVNFPDRYLRHQSFEIKLHGPNGPDDELWWKDSTFRMVPGLADPSGVSLQSLNYPDRYLRHRNFKLYLEPADSPLARADATFHRTNA